MRERRYKYAVWKGALRQAQGPGFLRYGTVGELAELAVKFRDRGSFGTVSELASGEPAEPVELAVKLIGRGSFATVSEFAELAVKLRKGQKYLSASF